MVLGRVWVQLVWVPVWNLWVWEWLIRWMFQWMLVGSSWVPRGTIYPLFHCLIGPQGPVGCDSFGEGRIGPFCRPISGPRSARRGSRPPGNAPRTFARATCRGMLAPPVCRTGRG